MSYEPERGDLAWIDFNPQVGHEQAGRRPALILSPKSYNTKIGLAIVCPITNQAKGYPFEVHIPDGLAATGVILSDQAKSISWKGRCAAFICKVPDAIVRDVIHKLRVLL